MNRHFLEEREGDLGAGISQGKVGLDGVGVGRGFRMGNTCTPMADSCQCMAKPTTIL